MENEKINVKLPCNPEYVSVARLTASLVASKMGFNVEEIEDIKVAVGEGCNNAILHGKGSDNNFQIEFSVLKDKLSITIQDYGNGFDLDNYSEPNINELPEGGLGIFIIHSLMDNVDIKTEVGNGSVIVMEKSISIK